METEKKKRGRPPKRKSMEFEGMTYEGAINNALDQEVRADLDKSLADKDESQLTDDERKYLKRKREKKSYTLNVRFTESEMQDILARCEQYGYKNKTEYIRDCVRARVDLTPDRSEIAECNRLMKRIGAKKFTAIDTLIAKMKHRDELEPVYKEYQGKSGWSQSRFKKKNSATIEDYEQTVKYIREHIKRYAVAGEPPTMLDLLEKSNKLKLKWNRLNVEHTAFLTKRETAKKYTRQVRQYINEQQMKREREKSRQRTQTKHRNFYLE